MTSPAQMAANGRNGPMSKGPKTDEGKARSSKNATTHGVYRSGSGAVTAGPFAEDPEHVEEQVQAIVRGLRPRDDLERIHAREIAELYLDLERTREYKRVSLAAPAVRRRTRRGHAEHTEPDSPAPDDAEQIMARLSNALRLSGTVYRQLRIAKAEYDQLQKRPLERGFGYAGELEIPTDINPLVDARGQAALWASRVSHLEDAEARLETEKEWREASGTLLLADRAPRIEDDDDSHDSAPARQTAADPDHTDEDQAMAVAQDPDHRVDTQPLAAADESASREARQLSPSPSQLSLTDVFVESDLATRTGIGIDPAQFHPV